MLRVATLGEDRLRELHRHRAHRARPVEDAPRRPLCVLLVRRHAPIAWVEQLNRRRRRPRPQLLVHEREGRRVESVDAYLPPLSDLHGDLDLRLGARRTRSRRQDGRAVVAAKLGEGPLHPRPRSGSRPSRGRSPARGAPRARRQAPPAMTACAGFHHAPHDGGLGLDEKVVQCVACGAARISDDGAARCPIARDAPARPTPSGRAHDVDPPRRAARRSSTSSPARSTPRSASERPTSRPGSSWSGLLQADGDVFLGLSHRARSGGRRRPERAPRADAAPFAQAEERFDVAQDTAHVDGLADVAVEA